mmetsp:Transcript_10666/g.24749  ORF Transcript_10666/g.24749 Transcript_10666/m.24749 type:complete len:96 (-) Transcript_10666:375-662(-)
MPRPIADSSDHPMIGQVANPCNGKTIRFRVANEILMDGDKRIGSEAVDNLARKRQHTPLCCCQIVHSATSPRKNARKTVDLAQKEVSTLFERRGW